MSCDNEDAEKGHQNEIGSGEEGAVGDQRVKAQSDQGIELKGIILTFLAVFEQCWPEKAGSGH